MDASFVEHEWVALHLGDAVKRSILSEDERRREYPPDASDGAISHAVRGIEVLMADPRSLTRLQNVARRLTSAGAEPLSPLAEWLELTLAAPAFGQVDREENILVSACTILKLVRNEQLRTGGGGQVNEPLMQLRVDLVARQLATDKLMRSTIIQGGIVSSLGVASFFC
jgi:hypothetical protein